MVELPLVSVIIINYNYGRFLRQTVSSVLAQTYPKIECILVDNASTDESGEIIAALEAAHDSIKVLRRESNDGQTPASLDGLAASAGQYIIFLDADDALLPRCVETHIFVHLSLRIHVGFTAGDMLQVFSDEVVVSTGEAMNDFIRNGKGRRPRLFRPYRHPMDPHWPPPELDGMAEKIFYVPPLSNKWVWSATSGLCYRRDALLLLSDNEALAHLRTGTDMYFAHGIGALCGSVLIDEPLFVYRIPWRQYLFEARPIEPDGLLHARRTRRQQRSRTHGADRSVHYAGRTIYADARPQIEFRRAPVPSRLQGCRSRSAFLGAPITGREPPRRTF